MPGKEEKKLIKRTKIIEAAYELFTKNGIDVTPIDEVVKKAGVAKGTFYLYFRDKYDLTDQIVLHESTGIIKKVLEDMENELSEKSVSPVKKVQIFADKMIDAMIANKDMIVLVNSKLSGLFGLLVGGDDPEIRQNTDKIINFFSEMGYNRDEAKMHVYLVANMMATVCCEAVLGVGPYSIEDIRPEIKSMLSRLFSQSENTKGECE